MYLNKHLRKSDNFVTNQKRDRRKDTGNSWQQPQNLISDWSGATLWPSRLRVPSSLWYGTSTCILTHWLFWVFPGSQISCVVISLINAKTQFRHHQPSCLYCFAAGVAEIQGDPAADEAFAWYPWGPGLIPSVTKTKEIHKTEKYQSPVRNPCIPSGHLPCRLNHTSLGNCTELSSCSFPVYGALIKSSKGHRSARKWSFSVSSWSVFWKLAPRSFWLVDALLCGASEGAEEEGPRPRSSD